MLCIAPLASYMSKNITMQSRVSLLSIWPYCLPSWLVECFHSVSLWNIVFHEPVFYIVRNVYMYRGEGEHCWWVALNFVAGSHYQPSEIKINWLSGLPYITLYMLPWVWFPSYRNSMEADRNAPTTSCSFGISSSYSILAGKLVVQSQTKEWWKVINIDSIFNHTVLWCLTLCRSNLKPYCMGRKAAFFSVGI